MQEPILKAVAVPPRIFWAPFALAIVNATVQFGLMLMWVAVAQGSPMWFIFSIVAVHTFLVVHSTYDPHLYRMLGAWGRSRPHTTENVHPSRGAKFAP